MKKSLKALALLVTALTLVTAPVISAAAATVNGAQSGAVYIWNSAYGDSTRGTLYNGSQVGTPLYGENGRIYTSNDLWLTGHFVIAQIEGAQSGNVYMWRYPNGDATIGTLPVGTQVNLTGVYMNNRFQATWNRQVFWLTDSFVY